MEETNQKGQKDPNEGINRILSWLIQILVLLAVLALVFKKIAEL